MVGAVASLAVVAFGLTGCAGDVRHVDFDKCELANLSIDSTIVADEEMEQFIRPYRDSLKIRMSREVCISDEDMVAKRPESNLTRFISDVYLAETRALAKRLVLPSPDFALLNVGGMRSSLPQGQLYLSNVFQLAPFENASVLLSLDSAAVCELMEHIAQRGGEAISGATFAVNAGGHADDIKIGGEYLKSGVTYRLATIDYLADGGDGFECLVGQERYLVSGIPLRSLLTEHLVRMGKAGTHAKAPTDVRIRFTNNMEEK